jgi:hypothetical protein
MARDMNVAGRQAKRGIASEHLRHPYVISGQFESLRGSGFSLSRYTTLTCINRLSYRPSLCDFLLLGVSHSRHGDQKNYKAELLVTCSFIRGIQNLLWQEPYKGAATGFPGKIRHGNYRQGI